MDNTVEKLTEQIKETTEKVTQYDLVKNLLKSDWESTTNDFGEIGMMLSMPDDEFKIIAPLFLDEMRKSLNNPNDKMMMVQALNASDTTIEEFLGLLKELESTLAKEDLGLSTVKKDFLLQLFSITYNTVAEAEGAQRKIINFFIELCNENAKIPQYAHLTDSGMDVYALEDITIAPGETVVIPVGFKVAIPEGYELQVRPKSGRCVKTKLRIANTPGTIDAGYRDEVGVIIDNIDSPIKKIYTDEEGRITGIDYGSSYTIGKGEKFAQLVLCQVVHGHASQVEDINIIANDGRKGGFGSTGLK